MRTSRFCHFLSSVCFGLCLVVLGGSEAADKYADPAISVDRLLNARGKVNYAPLIAEVVSLGDLAVPVLTNRLQAATNRNAVRLSTTCLAKIGSELSLKPLRDSLHDSSRDHELPTASAAASDSSISLWCLRLTTAIQRYPTNCEAEILPDLIRLSEPSYGGMVHYYATERLREMIRRQPSVAGAIVDALDDTREHFSWNLGDIIAMESGHANRWGVSDPPNNTIVARRNIIWREWWKRNQGKGITEWKQEAQHVSATIPIRYTNTNAPGTTP